MNIRKTILALDDAIVVVDKPAGLLTIADGYNPSLPHLAKLLEQEFGRIWVVHRLDKETSGVIVFARNQDAHRALNAQFQERGITKQYHALVLGVPEWETRMIQLPLRINGDRRHRTIIDNDQGKTAETKVKVIGSNHGIAYLEVIPHTGYTHQIRAHLAAIGRPLLHDPLYQSLLPLSQDQIEAQKFLPSLPIHRTALHAYGITLSHPITGNKVQYLAQEPIDFRESLKILSIK